MREGWERIGPAVAADPGQLDRLVQAAWPGERVLAATAAPGGLANANFKLTLAHRPEPVLLRLYTRDPAAAALEVALCERLVGLVPLPRTLAFLPADPLTGRPCLIREWIDGERLEIVAPQLPPADLSQLARSVGAAAATIHRLTFPCMGLLDAALQVAQPFQVSGADLLAFARTALTNGPGRGRVPAAEVEILLTFIAAEGRLLDSWSGPPCLVHGDFGGSNLLVRQGPAGWAVVAVLDWEFALSGTPFMDLGNLLRPPLGNLAGVPAAVAAGYRAVGGVLPEDWLRLSRLTDLYAWLQFLSRPTLGPQLMADAVAMLRRTVAGWGGSA